MKKKKTRKKKILPVILTFLAALIVAAAVVVVVFRTRTIEVTGSTYYSENTIRTWIQNDKLSVNSLYIVVKYDLLDGELPTGAEKFHVALENPWTVLVTVEEKEMAGYVEDDGAYLFFDGTGTAALRTKKPVEGVPYIEGLTFDAAKVELGTRLPVEDEGIFEDIVDVTRNLKKYELVPDRLTCADDGIRLTFGIVEVTLGESGYEEKLQQVQPILEKLSELYPDTAGTLYLDNYTKESDSIRFVPSE